MPANKVSELLPIPNGVKNPHAYQVFGLEGGEQNKAKIKAAIAATVARLKEQKGKADPAIWKSAVKLVEQAQAILVDPKKRRELDAQFGVVAVSEKASDAADEAAAPFDPLAGVLPAADPLATVDSAKALTKDDGAPGIVPAPDRPADNVPSPKPIVPASGEESDAVGQILTPASISGGSTSTGSATVSADASAPVTIKNVAPRYKRRAKKNWFLVLFMLGMFAAIGLLAYFVFFGPGELAITKSNDGIKIRAGAAADPESEIVSPPMEIEEELDPVMSSALSNPNGVDADLEESINEMRSLGKPGDPIEPLPKELQSTADTDATTDSPDSEMEQQPKTEMQSADPVTMLDVKPSTESGEVEMTKEAVAATDKKIEKLRETLRGAKWKQMTPAAEELKEELLTDDQRKQVDSLYELADLAAFYYGAIERGIASRQPAEAIDVTDQLRIVIVEIKPDALVIRVAGRNRTYTFDELPLILAHKMAEFALPPDQEINLAAKACYQALALKSESDDRKESIEWLHSIETEAPSETLGANPKEIAKTIEELY